MRGLGVIALAAAFAAVLAGAGVATAAKQPPRPVVSWIDATPTSIPARGGAVLVRAYVKSAVQCAFAEQHGESARVVHLKTVSCKAGHATIRAAVPPNPTSHLVVVRFRVTAANAAHRRVTAKFEAVQQPSAATTPAPDPTDADPIVIETVAVPPASLGVAYSTNLAATGGAAPYTWSITAGALPAGLELTASGTVAGTPTIAGTYAFSAQVVDGKGQNDTTDYVLTVATALPGGTATSYTSTNWSGYFLEGGPFTGVTGTFNVPSLFATTVDSSSAEWVGVDGTSSNNPSIIQSGVAEDWSVAANSYVVTPWIELFPAPAYRLPLTVSVGDQVTVTISQLAPGMWNVIVQDDTTGETFSENDAYSGPASSAEWIVEAPFSNVTQSIVPVADFSPVTFSRLGVNPVVAPLSRVVMVQHGAPVSTPSDLTPNGFTVAYGSVVPTAP